MLWYGNRGHNSLKHTITRWMWGEIREKRRSIIETDWTQNPDVPDATKSKWQTYRD